MINHGVMMVSEDRKGEGLILIRSVMENISPPNLDRYVKRLFINDKQAVTDAEHMIKNCQSKPRWKNTCGKFERR